jgi:hypothetical protein
MTPTMRILLLAAVVAQATTSQCSATTRRPGAATQTLVDSAFREPQPVNIQGFAGDAMEPFVTRDGQWLLFNTAGLPGVDVDIHVARAIDSLTFAYVGLLTGANSTQLDDTPTMDARGTMYFVSMRDYWRLGYTVHRARFANGGASSPGLVAGLPQGVDIFIFDVEISADGETMYYSNGIYRGRSWPDESDLFVARRRGDAFVRDPDSPRIFAAINTDDALEYGAAISRDELEIFFTRQRGKVTTIHRSTRASPNDPFGTPARIGAITGFVEAPSVSPDGRAIYYHELEGRRYGLYRAGR